MLTVIILTRDEEKHISRAIKSVKDIASRIIVVDSGSTDNTIEIAKDLGAEVKFNPWKNHATQFNWALTCLPSDTNWIMRLDADEVVSKALADEIFYTLHNVQKDVNGISIPRRMTFMGKTIRHGGVFPVKVLRIFKYGAGHCEQRWMDEHIKISGKSIELKNELLDDNLNSLTWWTEKHNSYSSREVVDILNMEFKFSEFETVAAISSGQAGFKRWIKEKIYARMPMGFRAIVYFIWRYVLRLGFLDGREGLAFHALQGLWYRILVDSKLVEVKKYMSGNNTDAPAAIRSVLGINVIDDEVIKKNNT